MDGLQRLLDFTHYLRAQRLLFHIREERPDAITVSFGTFGVRFCLDFHEHGIDCRRYCGMRDAHHELREIDALIDGLIDAESRVKSVTESDGGEGAPGWRATPTQAGGHDVALRAGGIRHLLDFTAHLRRRRIGYTIEQQSCDALEVGFSVHGKRIEVEFSPDRASCNVFVAEPPSAFDEEAVRREVEVFTRPYHPAMRMRQEWLHAGE